MDYIAQFRVMNPHRPFLYQQLYYINIFSLKLLDQGKLFVKPRLKREPTKERRVKNTGHRMKVDALSTYM